jgi:hypothetical protein
VIKLKLLSAGLLLLVAVSALGTYTDPVVQSYFKTNKPMVCVSTADIKEQLVGFHSMWAGVNINEESQKVDSIVEFYTTNDREWIIIEHFPSRNVSCTLGIGEEWEFNPKFTKRGSSI